MEINNSSIPRVSVTIPFYNGDKYISNCVQSVLDNDYPVEKVYVIDNSTEPTNLAGLMAPWPKVEIIKTRPGIGFGRACNIGVYRGMEDGMDICIVFNQDAVMEPHCIGHLVYPFLQQADIFATVPISLTYNFESIIDKSLDEYILSVNDFVLDLMEDKRTPYYELNYDQTNGSCVAYRCADIQQIGLFDPVFPHYGEDDDLLIRAIYRFQKKVVLSPDARIGHIHSHFSHSGREKDKIEAYVHLAQQMVYMKRSDTPLWLGVLKALVYNMMTYGKALLHGRLYRMRLFIQKDWQLLGRLKRIILNRKQSNLLKDISLNRQKDLEDFS